LEIHKYRLWFSVDEHSLCDHWNHVFVASAAILAAILDDTDLGVYVKLVINAMTN